jgi:PilZ domain
VGAERREHSRVDVLWKARIAWPGHGIVDGRVRNISKSGILLETSVTANTGELLLVEFEASVGVDVRQIRVRVKVMHRSLQSQSVFGYGMLFDTITDDDRRFLQGFVERNS